MPPARPRSGSSSCSRARRRRARDTARLAGFADAIVDDDLLEWDYGEYEGLTREQIQRAGAGLDDLHGERARRRVRGRGRGARRNGCWTGSRASGDRCSLFAHGHFLRVLTATALGLGPRAGACFALDPATISVLGSERETRTIRRWNVPVPLI